jgi:hypothetical protein
LEKTTRKGYTEKNRVRDEEKTRSRARARDCEFRIRFRQPLFDASVVFVEVVFFIVIITRARARALHGAFEKKNEGKTFVSLILLLRRRRGRDYLRFLDSEEV